MASEMTLQDIKREISENLTVNGIPPSEVDFQIALFKGWGQSAYDSITNNVPCVPETDIVVHAQGEQFPMHRSIFLQLFDNFAKWPTMDGYNLDCFIPAHHFRALRQYAYTGHSMKYATHMFRELSIHILRKDSPDGPFLALDMEGMMAETLDARLSVARHILEFVMLLEASRCSESSDILGEEASGTAMGCWNLTGDCGDLSDEMVLGWTNDIDRASQEWYLRVCLLHDIKRVSSHCHPVASHTLARL